VNRRGGDASAFEDSLRPPRAVCTSCGADWSQGGFSETCRECGGAALDHACLLCDGKCGQRWRRAVIDSQDEHESHWRGNCCLLGRGPRS
jgi:hypothetical protein